MKSLSTHKLFNFAAHLVITASIICVLFGNGVHVHAIFDHILEHGDVHAFVHSHSADHSQSHSHAEEFDDKNAHQHPTATVELTGTFTQKTTAKASVDSELFLPSGSFSSYSITQFPTLLYLDLPPPNPLYQSEHFYSYSLRGPPMG